MMTIDYELLLAFGRGGKYKAMVQRCQAAVTSMSPCMVSPL